MKSIAFASPSTSETTECTLLLPLKSNRRTDSTSSASFLSGLETKRATITVRGIVISKIKMVIRME